MKKSRQAPARINDIAVPWETLAAQTQLGGLTLSEFRTMVAECTETREQLAALWAGISAMISRRNAADETARKLIRRVVAGVIAEPSLGADSALYRAMKYIPDNERASGANRKSADSPTAPSDPIAP
jgi:hypothetical protein